VVQRVLEAASGAEADDLLLDIWWSGGELLHCWPGHAIAPKPKPLGRSHYCGERGCRKHGEMGGDVRLAMEQVESSLGFRQRRNARLHSAAEQVESSPGFRQRRNARLQSAAGRKPPDGGQMDDDARGGADLIGGSTSAR
jgi:hypothetical protein